jgi:hypothetical protein
MSSTAPAPTVLACVRDGAGLVPAHVSSRLRRAFSLGTDAGMDTWEEVTGHRAAQAWVHWQVRAVLSRHGMVGAEGNRYAATVAGLVAREATRAVEAGNDPRRAVLTAIPREPFQASRLWPGLYPLVGRCGNWEQFLGAAHIFYAQANADAAAAVAASDTATTFGPMGAEELGVETAKIARWVWQTFAPHLGAR